MKIRRMELAGAAAVAAALAGCATYGSISRDRGLYDQLGGKTVVEGFVDDTVDAAAADERTRETFARKDLAHIKESVAAQICSLTGGPCAYKGKSMEEVHKGLNIRSGEFNAFVEDLQKAMSGRHVPLAAQNKLLAILAPMRRAIIDK